MSKFAIERDGKLVNHIIFIGKEPNNYKQKDIVPLIFDNEKQALELLSVWEDAKLVDLDMIDVKMAA